MVRLPVPQAGPAGAGAAPGELEKVRQFVNTLDIEQGTDLLDSPPALDRWLRQAGLARTDTGAVPGPPEPGARQEAGLAGMDRGSPEPGSRQQAALAGPDAGRVPGRGGRGAVRQEQQGGRQCRPATAADLRRAVATREALRGVLRSHAAAGAPASGPGPAAALRSVASTLPARLDVNAAGRVTVVPADESVTGSLARILLICAEAAATGSWSRLKACSADDCQWAFYDRSPARSGCWCSMAVCGSRAKSRAYRRRAGSGRQSGPAATGGGRQTPGATASRSARTAAAGA
jgi:predicted RNA-binding Zn ribbon-like protein